MQPEPHWANYVAIVTGIIGAFAGIAGSIMGYIAYRRSNEIKRSDRRLDLKKLRNDVHFAAKGLNDLLPKALLSRQQVVHARGLLGSSIIEVFKVDHTTDLNRSRELSVQIPPEDIDYDSMPLRQLEEELVRIDRIKTEIDELLAKYQDSIQQDSELLREQR